MGCFGWNCNECENPILGFAYHGYNKFMSAVVLFSNGDRVSGEYDGYGRLGRLDLVDEGNFRIIHADCDKGQKFEDLKADVGHDETQAGGFDEHKMEERYGPPDLDSIVEPFDYACKRCFVTWKTKWAGGRCPNGCELVKDEYGGVWDVAILIHDFDKLAVCHNEECYRSGPAFTVRNYGEDEDARSDCPACKGPITYPTLLDALVKTLE